MATTGSTELVSLVALSDGEPGTLQHQEGAPVAWGDWTPHHLNRCVGCGETLCSHPTLCPEMGLQATPTTVPGFVVRPGVAICVLCADELEYAGGAR